MVGAVDLTLPSFLDVVKFAGLTGFEPATCGFGDRCSATLSYIPRLLSYTRRGLPVWEASGFRSFRTFGSGSREPSGLIR